MTADQITSRFDDTRRELRADVGGIDDPDLQDRLDEADAALASAGAVLSGLLATAGDTAPSQH